VHVIVCRQHLQEATSSNRELLQGLQEEALAL
jgi:hypothetical protein